MKIDKDVLDNSYYFKDRQIYKNLKSHKSHNTVTYNLINHRDILQGEFWRKIPAYESIDEKTFTDHKWQGNNTITKPQQFIETIGNLLNTEQYKNILNGFLKAPMSLRISPYLISLINWSNLNSCPIRQQFIPFGTDIKSPHPMLTLDSLNEQKDSRVPGLVHRYHDKALFLALDICPVYCRFCTRSYAVGTDTESVKKIKFDGYKIRWEKAFEYITNNPQIEDIVISGGDTYHLKPDQIEYIGIRLLQIPNIRRIRFATKGIAVMPQKIFTHMDWTDALTRVSDYARANEKSAVIHTHFNHAREITWMTQKAMKLLLNRGVHVRNQTVLLKGVNDTVHDMLLLIKQLEFINIQPYYVYVCDMIQGIENLRTPLKTAINLESYIRGATSGFNTPSFICDTPGGGGKRLVNSYEYYNEETGISIFSAPAVKPGKYFLYFDPLQNLSLEMQAKWQNENERTILIKNALDEVKKTSTWTMNTSQKTPELA